MIELNSIVGARNWLLDYLYDREEALEEDIREGLHACVREISPVKTVVEAVKLIFDRQPDCPEKLLEFGAAAAALCSAYGLSGMDPSVAEILKP